MKNKMTKTQRRIWNFFARAGRGEICGSIEQDAQAGRSLEYWKYLMVDLKRSGHERTAS